jgi:hypothetical protein
MNEAKALRALADKLDELDSLKAFPAEITDPGEVTVSWSEGKDHAGYPALSGAISALVSQHWSALRSQVLKTKESEVQAARNAWTATSTTTTAEPEAAATPAPSSGGEVGLRRYG